MGGIYVTESVTGATPDEALATMLNRLTADDQPDPDEGYEGWTDPHNKPGYIQVWEEPVTDDAIAWMRGWVEQNPPAALVEAAMRGAEETSSAYGFRVEPDPLDKFGPWLMFPLARGGWHFFGWVNT
jgi:hypothetical protein